MLRTKGRNVFHHMHDLDECRIVAYKVAVYLIAELLLMLARYHDSFYNFMTESIFEGHTECHDEAQRPTITSSLEGRHFNRLSLRD